MSESEAEAVLQESHSLRPLPETKIVRKDDFHCALACLKRARHFRSSGREKLAEPQVARCRRLLEEMLVKDSESLKVHFLYTATLMEQGDFTSARAQALRLLYGLSRRQREDMRDAVLHLAVAHACWRIGHSWQAMSFLLEATKVYPNQPQLCAVLSEILLSVGYQSSGKDVAQNALLQGENMPDEGNFSPSLRSRAAYCLTLARMESGLPPDPSSLQPRAGEPRMTSEELKGHAEALRARLRRRRHTHVEVERSRPVGPSTSKPIRPSLPSQESQDPGLDVLLSERCPGSCKEAPPPLQLAPPPQLAPMAGTVETLTRVSPCASLVRENAHLSSPHLKESRKAPSLQHSQPVLPQSPWLEEMPWLAESSAPAPKRASPTESIRSKPTQCPSTPEYPEVEDLQAEHSMNHKQVIKDLDLMRGLLSSDGAKDTSREKKPVVEGVAVNDQDWCCRRDEKDPNGNRRPMPLFIRLLRLRDMCRR